jgi:hypothetical protein
MNRVKRFVGVAKGASAPPVKRDEDGSLVLFGELYKNEKENDESLVLFGVLYKNEMKMRVWFCLGSCTRMRRRRM